jgi:hypothetical protein
VEFLGNSIPAKLSDIAAHFPHFNINTLKKDLQYLVSEALVESSGQKKGTVYRISKVIG